MRIVVTGFMGSCPISGVVWQHVHYLVGLQRLGHEVYYVEDTSRYPYNPETFDISDSFEHAAAVLGRLAGRHGFEGRWGFRARYLEGMPTAGLDGDAIRRLYREADAVMNVCGSQELNDDLLRARRLIYLESDPGVEQIKVDQGTQDTVDYLAAHHALFTFGESVPTSAFAVPVHGQAWLPTRQPVVSDFWFAEPRSEPGRFTSIANWSTSGKKDIHWRGETYLWSKSLEFLRFLAAPREAGEGFELATDIPDEAQRREFIDRGWSLVLPHALSADFDLYREYVRGSKGEFTVAKDQYVRLNTGWFSDRSACYLAAGRPVITQETGFTRHLPSGEGLFAFRSVDDIRTAVEAINSDYARHCRAAAEIAREYFEAEKVLASVLERAGVS